MKKEKRLHELQCKLKERQAASEIKVNYPNIYFYVLIYIFIEKNIKIYLHITQWVIYYRYRKRYLFYEGVCYGTKYI